MTLIGLSFAAARKILDEYALSSIQGIWFAVGKVLLPSRGLIGIEFHGDWAENKRGEALVAWAVADDADVADADDADAEPGAAAEPVTTFIGSLEVKASATREFSPLLAYARTGTLAKITSNILRSKSVVDVEPSGVSD